MIWLEVKKLLKKQLPENIFRLWIEPLRCLNENQAPLVLLGPDPFSCNWVKKNYLPAIKQALSELNRPELEVCISAARPADEPEEAATPHQLPLPSIRPGRSRIPNLHPRFTFDEFMVGESNALAHSACRAIAVGSDEAEHCVFLNSATGLGKSHLAQAVAHHMHRHHPETRLYCLSGQQFTTEFVNNLRNNTIDQFKERLFRSDVLLVEDVQSLSGRNKIQTELAEVVDMLLMNGRRVLFTGSVAPREIPNLDDGVRSRLAAGLVTTINPPDLQTRRLIIRRKAKFHRLELADELVEYLAEKLHGDIRRVESALVGLKAKRSLTGQAVNLKMVQEVVTALMGQELLNLNAETIRDFIADQFRVSVEQLQSRSRKKEVAFPRQVSMYLSRKLTDQALADIGRAFNRDHSTVLHSIKVMNETAARNCSVRKQLELLSKRLREREG